MRTKERLLALDAVRAEMVLDVDGLRFSYSSLAEYRRLAKAKPWDAPLYAWANGFASDDVFYDIGANVGQFALRVGARRLRTVAIEPGADSFASLCRNVTLNGLSDVVTPLPVALCEATGLRPFHYWTVGPGSALHALGEPVDYKGKRFEPAATQPVLSFALDDLIAQFGLPQPTRIKLDVDGTQAAVLAGARRTLTAGPMDLWVELVEARAGDDAAQRVARDLEALGFVAGDCVIHDTPAAGYPRIFDSRFVRR